MFVVKKLLIFFFKNYERKGGTQPKFTEIPYKPTLPQRVESRASILMRIIRITRISGLPGSVNPKVQIRIIRT